MTTVAILIFEGCDVMDATGPYEVFLTASRLSARDGGSATFDVRTVSLDGMGVRAYGGLGLTPSHGSLADQDDLDIVVVPGLIDLEAGLADERLVSAIREAAGRAGLTASVCTGSFLLDAAGLLADVSATTHWEDVDALAGRRSAGSTRDDVRWVDAGSVVTAAGLSSGIAMALHLVGRFSDRGLAEATARQIDYVWTEQRG